MAENSHDLLTIADQNVKPLWVNKAWKKIFGEVPYREDPIEMIHPDDVKEVSKKLESLMTGKEKRIFLEYRYKNPKGEYITLETTATLEDVGGRPFLFIAAKNITERDKVEKQKNEFIKKTKDRLAQIMPILQKIALGDFSKNMGLAKVRHNASQPSNTSASSSSDILKSSTFP